MEVERTTEFCSLSIAPWPVPDRLRRTDKMCRRRSAFPVDRVCGVQSFNRLQIVRIDKTRLCQVQNASTLHMNLKPRFVRYPFDAKSALS